MKQKTVFFSVIVWFLPFQLPADEPSKPSFLNTLIDHPWGFPVDKFLASDKENYEKAASENQADFFVSKLPVMLEDERFKKIIKFSKEKGMSQISYMSFPTKDNIDAACAKTHDYLVKNLGKENHQAKNTPITSAVFVWNDLKDTTIEQICIAKGEFNLITLTVVPKWQVFTCKLENTKSPLYYYFDSWNHQIRQFNQAEISNVLKSTVTTQKIEFTDGSEKEHISIDRASHEIVLRAKGQKPIKGNCEVSS